MNASIIRRELLSMSVGSTKVVYGIAVTRWTEHVYETGTLGRTRTGLVAAIRFVRQNGWW